MLNKVKKCTSCGKPNAFTLSDCNACGAKLPTEISYTNNIFSGFVYGVQKGPFPFTISLRYQSEELIVFDDLLSLCPCHLNVIPTTGHYPDWRCLLKDPKAGKKLLTDMYDACFNVVKEQFWANKEWRAKFAPKLTDPEQLKQFIAAGMNYPPSQYQLHLQFMLMPLLPFQYQLYLKGVHYTPGRFFPLEYVLQVLDAAKEPYPVTDDTPVEDIISDFKAKGVDYDAIHKKCYDDYGQRHLEMASWSQDEFEGMIIGDKFYKVVKGQYVEDPSANVGDLVKQDKMVLQNYGRPYKNGRPSGTYYKHAKDVK